MTKSSLDYNIDYVIKRLTTAFTGFKYISIECTERNIYELQQNFFKNKYYNLLLFLNFVKEYSEDVGIYIGKIFFNLFINNEKLEKMYIFDAKFCLNDYYKTAIVLSYFSELKTFVLNIASYGGLELQPSVHIHFSIEQIYKYLKIILITDSAIYNQFGMDLFLCRNDLLEQYLNSLKKIQ